MEVGIVFYQTENGYVHHLCHLHCFGNNHGNQFLRRGYDDNAINGQGLEHSQGNIASSGRHIHKHKVDVSPNNICPELFNHIGNHRTTPNNRVRFVGQEHIGTDDFNTTCRGQGHNANFVTASFLTT